jgi:hypothetical protein
MTLKAVAKDIGAAYALTDSLVPSQGGSSSHIQHREDGALLGSPEGRRMSDGCTRRNWGQHGRGRNPQKDVGQGVVLTKLASSLAGCDQVAEANRSR